MFSALPPCKVPFNVAGGFLDVSLRLFLKFFDVKFFRSFTMWRTLIICLLIWQHSCQYQISYLVFSQAFVHEFFDMVYIQYSILVSSVSRFQGFRYRKDYSFVRIEPYLHTNSRFWRKGWITICFFIFFIKGHTVLLQYIHLVFF